MLLTARQVHEGIRIPRLYGVAWCNYEYNTCTVYPIPFHWVARWGRSLWLRFKLPRAHAWWEKQFEAIRDEAYRDGYAQGRGNAERHQEAILKIVLEQVRRELVEKGN